MLPCVITTKCHHLFSKGSQRIKATLLGVAWEGQRVTEDKGHIIGSGMGGVIQLQLCNFQT